MITRPIFVFGSNLAGRHGAGAAKFAVEHHGATYGVGIGMQGWSYAIPTKDHSIKALPLSIIRIYAARFVLFAYESPNMRFQLTAIGCGLAGYTPEEIAPMFVDAPRNVDLPPEFKAVLGHV